MKTAAALQDLLHHMYFLLYVPLGLHEGRSYFPLFIHLLKNIVSMVKAVWSEISELGNVAYRKQILYQTQNCSHIILRSRMKNHGFFRNLNYIKYTSKQ